MNKLIKKLLKFLKSRSFVSLISFIFFIIATFTLIIIAKGYNINFKEKTFEKTGTVLISSEPKGALVYLNDTLQGITNNNISNLTPGNYSIKIEKEGYSNWQKKIQIQENLVIQIEARLFPLSPSLTPVTIYGCTNPQHNHDNTKIAFQISNDSNDKNGIYLLTFNNIPLGKGYDIKQILKDTDEFLYSKSEIIWSPDDSQILISINSNSISNFLLNIDILTSNLTPIDQSKEDILNQWETEQKVLENKKLAAIDDKDTNQISEILDNEYQLSWSPDEKSFYFFENEELRIYIIDKNEIINTGIKKTESQNITWFSDNERLTILDKYSNNTGKISIIEKDNSNLISLYEGSILSNNVYVSPNGNKIFFLTSFNNQGLSNLYSLNLK